MAIDIKYNQIINAQLIYRKTNAGVYTKIYSSDLDSAVVFDYFTDSAIVGDCIYFGNSIGKVGGYLSVDVLTALVADSITVVWEYSTWYNTWVALSGVTDNTNAFRNAGVNTVLFTIPNDWNSNVSPTYGYCIRARITAVSNITEGGRNSATKPTLKNGTITIIQGGSGGYLTCADIYAKEVAGSWGVVTKANNTYFLNCSLQIGDSRLPNVNATNAVILTVIGESLEIGISNFFPSCLLWAKNCTLQLGQRNATTGEITFPGTVILNSAYVDNYGPTGYSILAGNFTMYGSSFINYGMSSTNFSFMYGKVIIERSIYTSNASFSFNAMVAGSTIKNLITNQLTTRGLYVYTDQIAFDNVLMNAGNTGIGSANPVAIKNINFASLTNIFDVFGNGSPSSALDCLFLDYATQVKSVIGTTSPVDIKYTFNLTFTDETGAVIVPDNVLIKDAYGTTVYNAVWAGSMVIVSYHAHGNGSVLQRFTYTPFKITVTKAGYETAYMTGFEIRQPITKEITMRVANEVMFSNKGVALKLNKENYGVDRDVLVMP